MVALQGHYRYCEALFSLGEVKMAIEANISARNLCTDNPDGIKDLEQQHLKFITEMAECKGIFAAASIFEMSVYSSIHPFNTLAVRRY